jgi:hypothetical protein
MAFYGITRVCTVESKLILREQANSETFQGARRFDKKIFRSVLTKMVNQMQGCT